MDEHRIPDAPGEKAGQNRPATDEEAARAGENAAPPGLPDSPSPDFGTPERPGGTSLEFQDRWLRAEAELQNFRRRSQREVEETRRNAEEAVLRELITVLDDLERAIGALPEGGTPAGWAQGVTLTAQRMRDVLRRYGVELVDPLGAPFDPEFAEAILEVDAPQGVAPHAVVQVVQKGYRRGNRALRAARVVVARERIPEG
jgi:molecular chaperone GrpE